MKVSIEVTIPAKLRAFYYKEYHASPETLALAIRHMVQEQFRKPFFRLDEERLRFHLHRARLTSKRSRRAS